MPQPAGLPTYFKDPTLGAQVDYFTPAVGPQGQVIPEAGSAAHGSMAQQLMNSQLNINAMRPYWAKDPKTGVYKPYYTSYRKDPKTNKPVGYARPANYATLLHEEWIEFDQAVIDIARDRLKITQLILGKGLRYNLGNALGTTVLAWQDLSDMGPADVTMDARVRTRQDRVVYGTHYLPIPIVHAGFEINIRTLEASRRMGNPLDVTQAEIAARKVAEKIEQMFVMGTDGPTYGGGTVYGLANHPNANSVTLSTNWDEITASSTQSIGEQILDDVISMKQASLDAKHYGPWSLIIPANYEVILERDYKAEGQTATIRERILKIEGINEIIVSDYLTDDNVLLVEMKRETVRAVVGFMPRPIEWQSLGGGFVVYYVVMAIIVPQVRADQDGNSGITILT